MPALSSDPKVLVLTEPNFRGLRPIPNVMKELDSVKNNVPLQSLVHIGKLETILVDTNLFRDKFGQTLPQWESEGPVKTTVSAMQPFGDHADASIVHFACHGLQDQDSPLLSYFALWDHKIDVGRLMRLNFPNGYLAFLSCCQSARGDDTQRDEIIHMSQLMSFLGFRSVIGSMW